MTGIPKSLFEDDFFQIERVTLMNEQILFSSTTMAASCERTPVCFSLRTLGLTSMEKLSFAVELVLSEAERSFLSLRPSETS